MHGTEDGAETDLDLGHYERCIDEDLNRYSNLTTGKVYWNVLNKERRGAYLASTVQVLPHVPPHLHRPSGRPSQSPTPPPLGGRNQQPTAQSAL